MKASIPMSWWARRVCAGRDFPCWADLATAAGGNGQVAAGLATLLTAADPNTVIGASMMIARFADTLHSKLHPDTCTVLDDNLDRACHDQHLNDFSLDSQLEADDILCVAHEAAIARAALDRLDPCVTGTV